MKRHALTPVAAAIGMALAAPAFAVNIDFGGSNLYMKFLDGDQRRVDVGTAPSGGNGATSGGNDNGQWTEFELRIKATISKQVEAGLRLQSRSPSAYWTDFGGFGDAEGTATRSANMKARGGYVLLTPGYRWLDQALIGASDWGNFDPFTIGKLRYIDRDNYKGLYFKGPLANFGLAENTSWEFARLSLPNFLQSNYGQGPTCCSTDSTQFNEAVYIVQLKGEVAGVKLATSYQDFIDNTLDASDTNPLDGRDAASFARNRVAMVKAEGTAFNMVDLKGAWYLSGYRAPLFDQPWINSPKSSIRDNAFKLDVGLNSLPISGLTVNYQYFDIGAGFYSNTAARHETDVLLTEGSEAAWFRWGNDIWLGGAAKDLNQGPASPLCHVGGAAGRCRGDSGLAAGANGLTNNENMDFDEAPTESVQGWKGHTLLVGYELLKTPLSFEYTRVGYNYNWQNYSPTGPLSNYFALNNDRKTNIAVFKASHVLPVFGGLELGFKYKLVDDKNAGAAGVVADDRDTKDTGFTLSVGNQLFPDLFGSLSYGQYKRDVSAGGINYDNKKSILSARLSYNLTGFETGLLSQWVSGDGDPGETGTQANIKQYRMKAFVSAKF